MCSIYFCAQVRLKHDIAQSRTSFYHLSFYHRTKTLEFLSLIISQVYTNKPRPNGAR